MPNPIRIGILSDNYAWKRLINNQSSLATYILVRFTNLFLLLNSYLPVLRKLGFHKITDEAIYFKCSTQFKSIVSPKVDLFHFFNCVSFDRSTPWIASIESAIPWTASVRDVLESHKPDFSTLKAEKALRKTLEQISAPHCKGLLCISDCTYQIQKALLDSVPDLQSSILPKIQTVHPPQRLLQESASTKQDIDSQLRFAFVGRDFFRKGGRESLQILSEFKDHAPIHLTLVSDFRIDNPHYLLPNETIDEWLAFMEKNKDWISYHPSLPNAQVLELLQVSHVGLLPTWMDTYGYSVLECQATGCPVVTTAIRSLPEINPSNAGWTIPVPTNRLGHPMHKTAQEMEEFGSQLRNGLRSTIQGIIDNPGVVLEKSQASIDRIRQHHSPDNYRERLEQLYQGITTAKDRA